MIPTLPTLATICRVYGVGMGYFFAEPAKHRLSITRKAHLQGNGRGLDSVKSVPLNAIGEGARLAARMIEFPPGGASAAAGSGCETCVLLYVLEGRIQLDAGGMHELLEVGDCAYIESEMALSWTNAGKNRCRLLEISPATLPPAT